MKDRSRSATPMKTSTIEGGKIPFPEGNDMPVATMTVPTILLLPPSDPPGEDGGTTEDPLQDIVDSLLEGSHVVLHSGSELGLTMLVHSDGADDASALLGAPRGQVPHSILVRMPEHAVSGDPLAQATEVLTTAMRGDADVRARAGRIMLAIGEAHAPGPDSGAGAGSLSIRSPWNGGPPIVMHVGEETCMTMAVEPDVAALVPRIVAAEWLLTQDGDVVLHLKEFIVGLWMNDRWSGCPMETMRILEEAHTDPLKGRRP